MGNTWSGTWTNDDIIASPYQARNGVRADVDMGALGDVIIDAPPDLLDSTFYVGFQNPNRNTLTINAAQIQLLDGTIGNSVSTQLKHGVVGYTQNHFGVWVVSSLQVFAVPIATKAAAEWMPQAVNGPVALADGLHIASVERTALGKYTVTTDGMVITNHMIIAFNAYAVGLPVENSAEVIILSQTATTIDINTGVRNKNGQFSDSDLVQDPLNRLFLTISVLP